jgi:group I intron endonuclease
MICIYKIESPSGKIYIGQTRNLNKRLEVYKNIRCKKQRKLYNSLLKYGYENHKINILEECDISSLNEKEVFYIEKFKTFETDHGMNLTKGGLHSTMSEETKRKLSEGRIGEKHHFYGKKFNKEWREKLSKSHIGIVKDKKWRENLSKSHMGIRLTDFQKKVLYDSKIGKISSLCKNSKKIGQYNLNDELIKIWDCAMDLKRKYNWNNKNIGAVCRGERNIAYNFKWKFI